MILKCAISSWLMLVVLSYTFSVTFCFTQIWDFTTVLQLQCVTHAEKCSVYLTQQQEIPIQFSVQISESDLKDL